MHDLDYEFNNLTRFNHGSMTKISADLKHEAREKAARTYYLEHQTKNILRETQNEHDSATEKARKKLKQEMESVSDHMEDEWRQLFTNLSQFKTKIGS